MPLILNPADTSKKEVVIIGEAFNQKEIKKITS